MEKQENQTKYLRPIENKWENVRQKSNLSVLTLNVNR